MSEPTHAPAPPGKGNVNVPGIGKLPTWAVLAGVGVVVVLIVRNRSGSAAAAGAAAPADQAAATGADTTGSGSITPGGGAVDTSVSGQVASGPPFTSNAAWSQYVLSVLTSIDPGTLTAELGLYLAGQPVTPAQESDINAAVAVAGYPPVAGPNGQPPAINVSGSKSGGSGSSSGSSSPSSPGSPGGSWQYQAPQNLAAAAAGKGKIRVSWAPVVGPQGQRPHDYTVAYGHEPGAQTWKDTAAGTSITLTTAAGATEYIEVWANGGPVAPPHAGPIKATAGK